jgi:electron transfer flavoprotein alpha subunit
MTTLLLADLAEGKLGAATSRVLTAALQFGTQVHILIAGEGIATAAEEASALYGVEKIVVADDPAFAHMLAEPLANLIVQLAPGYSAILASNASSGKNVLPRVAAILDVMQVTEITKVLAKDTFERPIYAGNAVQTVQSLDQKLVATIRSSAFAVTAAAASGCAPIEMVRLKPKARLSTFKEEIVSKSERPQLAGARVVISGGRALQSAENFTEYLGPVADVLNAAIGASRAAVDAGYAPNDWQVGQTGKVVAPELYIAAGISGAIQHLAGMKDSKVIVAINKDEEAPIFEVADYGLVADLFTALPELHAELNKYK